MKQNQTGRVATHSSSPSGWLLEVLPPAAFALRRAAAVALGALALAAASQASLPWQGTFVPLSVQPQAVLVVAALLGPAAGPAAVLAWFGMGLAGWPVFANGESATALVGLKAGYLWSYPSVAALVGQCSRRSAPLAYASWMAGAVCTLMAGTSVLACAVGPRAAMAMGFAPFVVADALKATAAFIGFRLLVRRRA